MVLDVILKKDVISELPPLILPNTGNMGVPICLFAYGTAGLGVASAIASVIILLHFTVGVLLANKSFSLDILVKNVPIYGIIASVILYILAIGPIRGFALTLGLATVFDLFYTRMFIRNAVPLFGNITDNPRSYFPLTKKDIENV